MSTSYFGSVRSDYDEIREKRAPFGLQPGRKLGNYQGEHRAYYRQGAQKVW